MNHRYMKFALPLSILLLAGGTGTAHADEWRYWLGLHDFNVPDVDSHTYGVFVGASVDKQTKSGRHFVASADVFADRDKDDLDPDHIPIRWDVHVGTDGEFWQGSPHASGLDGKLRHPNEHGQFRRARDDRAAGDRGQV